MTYWLKVTLAVLGLIVVAFVLSVWIGFVLWNRKTSQFIEKLVHAPRHEAKTINFKDFRELPPPVERYFRYVLKEGQLLVRSARIIQAGGFRRGNRWSQFKAEQYFSAQPPGFVWDAVISMAPLLKVRVRDAYLEGHGSMQAKVLGLVSVVDESGKAELNAGALQRYLAEAVWFPTALLPGGSVKWSAIDDHRALATLTDSGTTVSLEFHFNDIGEITGVFTPGRNRDADGKYVLTPWKGNFGRYKEIEGMRIPMEGEVEWQLPGGSFPYWKGRIVEVKYDLVR